MRNDQSRLGSIVCWVMLVVLVLSTACTPAAVPSAAAPAKAAEGNTSVPAPATQKQAVELPTTTEAAANAASPTAEAPETSKAEQPTPLPATATPQPASAATEAVAAATVAEGFGAWCLPLEASQTYAKNPLSPPKIAKQANFADAMLHVHGLPASGCMFTVMFKGAAPSGLSLEVYEPKATTPFFKTNLQAVEGNTDTLWAYVQHGSIIAPGRTKSVFALQVKDPLGQVVQQAELKLYSWVPGTPEPKEDDCGCDIGPLPLP